MQREAEEVSEAGRKIGQALESVLERKRSQVKAKGKEVETELPEGAEPWEKIRFFGSKIAEADSDAEIVGVETIIRLFHVPVPLLLRQPGDDLILFIIFMSANARRNKVRYNNFSVKINYT